MRSQGRPRGFYRKWLIWAVTLGEMASSLSDVGEPMGAPDNLDRASALDPAALADTDWDCEVTCVVYAGLHILKISCHRLKIGRFHIVIWNSVLSFKNVKIWPHWACIPRGQYWAAF